MQCVRPFVSSRQGEIPQQVAAQIYGLLCALRLQQRGIASHFDSLRLRSNFEQDIDGDVQAGANDQSCSQISIEALQICFKDVAFSGGQFLQPIITDAVTDGLEGAANRRAVRLNLNTRECRSRGIDNAPVDASSCGGLGESCLRAQQQQTGSDDKDRGSQVNPET